MSSLNRHLRQLSASAIVRDLSISNFVPKHQPVRESDIKALSDFINQSERLLVLTGAGISTESGIPDYRSADVGLYARTGFRPILHQAFMQSAAVRQRYWARNYIGWRRFSQRQPNATHNTIAAWQKRQSTELMVAVVTQNVDSLHRKAGGGDNNVIELHGTAHRVICLDCRIGYDREEIQRQLDILNHHLYDITYGGTSSLAIRPDGDVEIPQDKVETFNQPTCRNCGGILKPDIVFFGDNVPPKRVELVRRHVTQSDAVLVLGSSLSVLSGYRIVLQAVDEQKAIAIVNIGGTRADSYANLRIAAKCGDIIPRLTV